MTIWKFILPVTDRAIIGMPDGAKILGVQVQDGCPAIWAVVDPNSILCTRNFAIVGTGHDMPPMPWTYIGTFQMHGGGFVGHVFELT